MKMILPILLVVMISFHFADWEGIWPFVIERSTDLKDWEVLHEHPSLRSQDRGVMLRVPVVPGRPAQFYRVRTVNPIIQENE